MSAIAQMLMTGAPGAIVSPLPITSLSHTQVGGANADANIILNSDGTMFSAGNGSVYGPNWFGPTSVSVGALYWAKMHVNSGDAANGASDLPDTWVSLVSGARWDWVRISVPGSQSANATVSISSDSSGTPVVSTATFNVTATIT